MSNKFIENLQALDIVRSQGNWITTEEKGEGNCYYARYKRNTELYALRLDFNR